jgi:hypothetical protein
MQEVESDSTTTPALGVLMIGICSAALLSRFLNSIWA